MVTSHPALVTDDRLGPWQPQAVAVTDRASYIHAGEYLNRLKAYRTRVEEYWETDIKDAYHHHRSLVAKRDALLAITATDESTVKYAMLTWKHAEDRRVAAEQTRQDALDRQAAADRALADAAALAEHAVDAGSPELAAMADSMIEPTYIEQEFAATRQTIQSAVPKVVGISTPKRLVVEVTDKRGLILAIAAGEMLGVASTDPAVLAFLRGFHPVVDGWHFVDVNLPNVRRAATSKHAGDKGSTFALPGVIAEKREDIR